MRAHRWGFLLFVFVNVPQQVPRPSGTRLGLLLSQKVSLPNYAVEHKGYRPVVFEDGFLHAPFLIRQLQNSITLYSLPSISPLFHSPVWIFYKPEQ